MLARVPPIESAAGATVLADSATLADIFRSTSMPLRDRIDGRLRLAGIAPIDNLPFDSIVAFDRVEMLKAWRSRATLFAFGYLALMALSFFLVRALIRVGRQRYMLREMANTYALTGISNRRNFMSRATEEFARARRYGTPLSVLILDIGFFKKINDGWGHLTGDRIIQAVAQALRKSLRIQDLCGCIGGEEFGVLLPSSSEEGACVLAERIRAEIECDESVRADDGRVVRRTVSIGAASLSEIDRSLDELVARSDRALYKAKQGGRNRVERDTDLAAGS